MSLKCKIGRGYKGMPVGLDSSGEESLLFLEARNELYNDGLDEVQANNKAFEIWATASSDEFQELTGKNEDTATYADYKAFARTLTKPAPLNEREQHELSETMRTYGFESLSEFKRQLDKIFRAGGKYGIETGEALSSGLYTLGTLNNVDISSVITLMNKIDRQLELGNDIFVEPLESYKVFQNDSFASPTLGIVKKQTLKDIEDIVKERVQDFTKEEEIRSVVRGLENDEFIRKFESNEAFAREFLDGFKGLRKIPVQTIGAEGLEAVSKRKTVLRNTFPAKLNIAPIKARLDYLRNLPAVVWETSPEEIDKLLAKTEEYAAEQGIDIIGIRSLPKQDVLRVLETLVESFETRNPDVLATVLDDLFPASEYIKIQRFDENFIPKTLINVDTNLSNEELFNSYGLIPLGNNIYQKINTSQTQEDVYRALEDMVSKKQITIPEVHQTGDILSDLERWLKTRDTGYGYKNAMASAYQLIFEHPAPEPQDTSSVSEVSDTDYLTQGFPLDFYKALLKQKLAGIQVYSNAFTVNNRDITLDDQTIPTEGIPLMEQLIEYATISKNPEIRMFARTAEEYNPVIDAINNKDQVKEFANDFVGRGDQIVTAKNSAPVIKVNDVLYAKGRDLGDISVYSRIEYQEDNTHYTTKYSVSPQEISLQELSDISARLLETDQGPNDSINKSGLASPFMQHLKETAKRIRETPREDQDTPRFMILGERGAQALDQAEESTRRLDNLAVARKMEEAGRTPLEIRVATEWERGADNLWRYETPRLEFKEDFTNKGVEDIKNSLRKEEQEIEEEITKIREEITEKRKDFQKKYEESQNKEQTEQEWRQFSDKKKEEIEKKKKDLNNIQTQIVLKEDGQTFSLQEVFKNNEVFEAFPELKNLKVFFITSQKEDAALNSSLGAYYVERQTISVNTYRVKDLERIKKILAHEIQHFIQEQEGFSRGSSVEQIKEWIFKNPAEAETLYEAFLEKTKTIEQDLQEIEDKAIANEEYFTEEVNNRFNDLYKSLETSEQISKSFVSQNYVPIYKATKGETEARNVEKREGLSNIERLRTLLSETEDISRDAQIELGQALGTQPQQESIGSPILQQLINQLSKLNTATKTFIVSPQQLSLYLKERGISDKVASQIIGEIGANNLPNHQERLKEAKQMEAQGKSAEDIWYKTRWEKGKDGKWRTEVPYLELKSRQTLRTLFPKMLSDQGVLLEDLIEAEDLFQAYPGLKSVRVFSSEKMSAEATYNEGKKEIRINPKYLYLIDEEGGVGSLAKTLVHEIQHAVQYIEGFPTGSNLYKAKKEITSEATQKYIDEINKEDKGLTIISKLNKIKERIPEAKDILKKLTDSLQKYQQGKISEDDLIKIGRKYNNIATYLSDFLTAFTTDELLDFLESKSTKTSFKEDGIMVERDKPLRPVIVDMFDEKRLGFNASNPEIRIHRVYNSIITKQEKIKEEANQRKDFLEKTRYAEITDFEVIGRYKTKPGEVEARVAEERRGDEDYNDYQNILAESFSRTTERILKTERYQDMFEKNLVFQTILEAKGLRLTPQGLYNPTTREILINQEAVDPINTTIHEFAHSFFHVVREKRRDVYEAGLSLVTKNQKEAQPYIDLVKATQPNLVEGTQEFLEEVLTAVLGDNGSRLVKQKTKGSIKTWISDLWNAVKEIFGLSTYTAEQVSNMTIQQFSDAVLKDMFSGQDINELYQDKRDINKAIEDLERARSVKYWMEPEFRAETKKYPQTGEKNTVSKIVVGDGTTSDDVVAYDKAGDIVGALSMSKKGGEQGAFKIVVREDATRQGWGKKLLDEAETQGLDIISNISKNSFSSRGRDLLRSWLRSKISVPMQPQAPLDVTSNQFIHDANFEMLIEPSENLQDKFDDCN
jgi:predicted SprT family Zn-dependent metalloprotease